MNQRAGTLAGAAILLLALAACAGTVKETPAHSVRNGNYPTCVDARETPQAVSLTYRFVFEQHNGHGSVRMTP